MRTIMFIVGGIIMWAIIAGLFRVLGNQSTSSWTPIVVFAVTWFIIAAWNMYVGVTQAGYTVMEELPIFFVLWLVPLAVAALIKAKFLE